MNKSLIGFIGSAVLTLIGISLRLGANSLAFSGVMEPGHQAYDTSWGHQETAIGQVGMALMAVGILLLVVTYVHWLFAKDSDK
jgi:hypothetical protein